MNTSITRSMLTDSLIFGKVISLHWYNSYYGQWVILDGRITSISLESGCAEGTAARHFNVTLATGSGRTYTTYVATID